MFLKNAISIRYNIECARKICCLANGIKVAVYGIFCRSLFAMIATSRAT